MTGTTATIEVISDDGKIRISSLLENGKPDKDRTWITFYKDTQMKKEIDTWDNPDWITHTYKSLYHRHYDTKEAVYFKNFCQENGMDFNEMEKVYIDVYKAAEKLGMFKN